MADDSVPAEVRELAEQASKQGMVLVDHGNIGPLLKEFDQVLSSADALLEVVDPEETPFKSKYEARKQLDNMANQLEANATVLKLEGKGAVIKSDINWRLARLRVRTGTIAWDVEEPHNTEQDLDHAASILFPGLVEHVREATPDLGTGEPKTGTEAAISPSALEATAVSLMHPSVLVFDLDVSLDDALRCLNLLGILWTGRENVMRGALFLRCSEALYKALQQEEHKSLQAAAIEDVHTHTLFYLAQCYGHIGDASMSSTFCHLTLQRQLSAGLTGMGLLDWIKNSMTLSDFYFSCGDFKQYSHVLEVCDTLLARHEEELLLKRSDEEDMEAPSTGDAADADGNPMPPPPPTPSSGEERKVSEFRADLLRRWIRLDVESIVGASERYRYVLAGLSPPDAETRDVVSALPNGGKFVGLDRYIGCQGDDAGPTSSTTSARMGLLCAQEIDDMEKAKVVFLRCAARVEKAKALFPLDGCVTDHVHLLEEHSKLYKGLAVFDPDAKRQLAMTNRRIDMLKPLLKSLNRAAYENQHKTISYELGEAAVLLIDIKMGKYRNPDTGELMLERMKKSEQIKCNEYALNAVHYFAHFTSMYIGMEALGTDGMLVESHMDEDLGTRMERAAALLVRTPDASFLTAEETRPFLNSHFFAARMLTRILVPRGGTASHRGQPVHVLGTFNPNLSEPKP